MTIVFNLGAKKSMGVINYELTILEKKNFKSPPQYFDLLQM